ncbi:uncharacterized protein G6M90_00g048520 [Metarhizium brunneum]|uniref:Uncharacterized protein n=1 Tax=Metarhizium brunneum TaxID=500148 RepID=A0A7D5Z659_9HYPO
MIYTYKWTRFVCGHHSARHQGGDGPVVVTENVVQDLFETVHSAINPSYQTATFLSTDGKTDSTGNYSQEDIALLQSTFSTETSAGDDLHMGNGKMPRHGMPNEFPEAFNNTHPFRSDGILITMTHSERLAPGRASEILANTARILQGNARGRT